LEKNRLYPFFSDFVVKLLLKETDQFTDVHISGNLRIVDLRGARMLINPRNFSYRREIALEQSAEESPVLVQEFVIANRLGIHARVAAQIVRVATQFESEILISKCGVTINGKSILDLITLICPYGTKINISAKGPDAAEALSSLAALFQTKFGEP
jgi:phosphocarrier protein